MKKAYEFTIPSLPSAEEGEEWENLCSMISLQGKQYPEIQKGQSVALKVTLYGEAERYKTFASLLFVLKAYFAAGVLSVDTRFTETSSRVVKTNGAPMAVVSVIVNYPNEKKKKAK